MKRGKREKLIVISPSGKQYTIGFLSRCTDGFVIGTPQIESDPSSHLTILKKDGKISSHITPQDHSTERQWFPPMTVDDATTRLKTLIEQKIILQLTPEHQSQNVLFITQKTVDCFNALMAALYQKEVSKKQVLHIINIKKVLEMLPVLFQAIKEEPSKFFGICKANEILTDNSKVLGISEAGLLFLPIENTLIGIQINAFLGIELVGLPAIPQEDNPLGDIYESLGLPQYIQKEIVEKKYLENLFSNEKIDEKTLKKLRALTQN